MAFQHGILVHNSDGDANQAALQTSPSTVGAGECRECRASSVSRPCLAHECLPGGTHWLAPGAGKQRSAPGSLDGIYFLLRDLHNRLHLFGYRPINAPSFGVWVPSLFFRRSFATVSISRGFVIHLFMHLLKFSNKIQEIWAWPFLRREGGGIAF